jgi:hypothetical protein
MTDAGAMRPFSGPGLPALPGTGVNAGATRRLTVARLGAV